MTRYCPSLLPALALIALPFAAGPAASAQEESPAMTMTYADLADLSDGAGLVLRAQVRKQAELKPERTPGLPAGMARLYVEARTTALLSGSAPVGESLRYLVDAGADITIADNSGRLPVDLAQQRGYDEMVALLER